MYADENSVMLDDGTGHVVMQVHAPDADMMLSGHGQQGGVSQSSMLLSAPSSSFKGRAQTAGGGGGAGGWVNAAVRGAAAAAIVSPVARPVRRPCSRSTAHRVRSMTAAGGGANSSTTSSLNSGSSRHDLLQMSRVGSSSSSKLNADGAGAGSGPSFRSTGGGGGIPFTFSKLRGRTASRRVLAGQGVLMADPV